MLQITMDCASGTDSLSASLVIATPLPTYTSRYSSTLAVRFGDQELQVHRFLLERSGLLSAAESFRNRVDFSNTAVTTGHVIIDYLYTGKLDGIEDLLPDFETLHVIFDVYTFAKRYKLDDLLAKAQAAIKRHTSLMAPSEALAALKKACPLPDGADTWLREYSKTLLSAAYADVASFLASDIMADENAESTMSMTEMLLRAIIGSVKEKEEQAAIEEAARVAAKEAAAKEAAVKEAAAKEEAAKKAAAKGAAVKEAAAKGAAAKEAPGKKEAGKEAAGKEVAGKKEAAGKKQQPGKQQPEQKQQSEQKQT